MLMLLLLLLLLFVFFKQRSPEVLCWCLTVAVGNTEQAKTFYWTVGLSASRFGVLLALSEHFLKGILHQNSTKLVFLDVRCCFCFNTRKRTALVSERSCCDRSGLSSVHEPTVGFLQTLNAEPRQSLCWSTAPTSVSFASFHIIYSNLFCVHGLSAAV